MTTPTTLGPIRSRTALRILQWALTPTAPTGPPGARHRRCTPTELPPPPIEDRPVLMSPLQLRELERTHETVTTQLRAEVARLRALLATNRTATEESRRG